MSEYSNVQYEMLKSSLVMQFGEVDGNRLFELQKKVMELSENGADEANMQRIREAQEKFNELFEEINDKIKAQSLEDDDDDYYDDDDDYYYDDDDETEVKTEYEKFLILYSEVFGPENGGILAKYMARISEINNDEGVNENNRKEYEELKAKYQELLDSLGGQQRIIEYSMNAYKNQDN